ncbi:Fic family protein [Levilactobacillus spicheri]|uniref:Fic family protein n=1 Tax=Levilactobacillus spicheri TaxID=216463 RepID=UPI0006995BCF|nr:Fic family protein [Levilactobacillus spicheri]
MKEYHSLKTFKYEFPARNVNDEYQMRVNSPTTIDTNLKINPMKQGIRQSKIYEIFLLPIPEILKLQDIITQNSNLVSKLSSELPPIASKQLFYKTLRDEIKSTNEIEDVKTTDQEVNEAIGGALSNSKRNTRLKSFARMYLKIENKENLSIKTPNDIKGIYDYLLDGEISKEKLPDGTLFRNKYVRIGSASTTVHQPKTHEADFLPDILDWINFINDDNIPFIIKTFISHYYFEYIHPFNDGNGRTGRYIACVYLGYKLDPLTAITFSSEINRNRSKYYKSFEEVGDERNFGEITFFAIDMMKILIKGQKGLLETLKEKRNILDYMRTKLKEKELEEISETLLYLYSQAFLFNDAGEGIEDRDLKKYTTKYPWTQVKNCLNALTEDGTLVKTKKSPIVRRLSTKYISTLAEEE